MTKDEYIEYLEDSVLMNIRLFEDLRAIGRQCPDMRRAFSLCPVERDCLAQAKRTLRAKRRVSFKERTSDGNEN